MVNTGTILVYQYCPKIWLWLSSEAQITGMQKFSYYPTLMYLYLGPVVQVLHNPADDVYTRVSIFSELLYLSSQTHGIVRACNFSFSLVHFSLSAAFLGQRNFHPSSFLQILVWFLSIFITVSIPLLQSFKYKFLKWVTVTFRETCRFIYAVTTKIVLYLVRHKPKYKQGIF